MSITASSTTRQHAVSKGKTAGLVGGGKSTSNASSDVAVNAALGGNTKTRSNRTGALRVTAEGVDNNAADTVAGSGGLASGNSSEATTADNSDVTTTIYSSTGMINAGTIDFGARHDSRYEASADSRNSTAIGASGALAKTDATTSATMLVGAGVTLGGVARSRSLPRTASFRPHRPPSIPPAAAASRMRGPGPIRP